MIIIKSVLIVLLLLCLLPMPYVYYIIVRYVTTICMIIFVNKDNPGKSFLKYIFYVIMGCLFNPFIIIELPRIAWNTIDLTLAILFLISAIAQYQKVQIKFFNDNIE